MLWRQLVKENFHYYIVELYPFFLGRFPSFCDLSLHLLDDYTLRYQFLLRDGLCQAWNFFDDGEGNTGIIVHSQRGKSNNNNC